MRIEWLEEALVDFEEAMAYLDGRNPQAARKLAANIHLAVSGLKNNPKMGRPGRAEATRELVVGHNRYIVPCRLRGDVIEILAVMHDAREWPGNSGTRTKIGVEDDLVAPRFLGPVHGQVRLFYQFGRRFGVPGIDGDTNGSADAYVAIGDQIGGGQAF